MRELSPDDKKKQSLAQLLDLDLKLARLTIERQIRTQLPPALRGEPGTVLEFEKLPQNQKLNESLLKYYQPLEFIKILQESPAPQEGTLAEDYNVVLKPIHTLLNFRSIETKRAFVHSESLRSKLQQKLSEIFEEHDKSAKWYTKIGRWFKSKLLWFKSKLLFANTAKEAKDIRQKNFLAKHRTINPTSDQLDEVKAQEKARRAEIPIVNTAIDDHAEKELGDREKGKGIEGKEGKKVKVEVDVNTPEMPPKKTPEHDEQGTVEVEEEYSFNPFEEELHERLISLFEKQVTEVIKSAKRKMEILTGENEGWEEKLQTVITLLKRQLTELKRPVTEELDEKIESALSKMEILIGENEGWEEELQTVITLLKEQIGEEVDEEITENIESALNKMRILRAEDKDWEEELHDIFDKAKGEIERFVNKNEGKLEFFEATELTLLGLTELVEAYQTKEKKLQEYNSQTTTGPIFSNITSGDFSYARKQLNRTKQEDLPETVSVLIKRIDILHPGNTEVKKAVYAEIVEHALEKSRTYHVPRLKYIRNTNLPGYEKTFQEERDQARTAINAITASSPTSSEFDGLKKEAIGIIDGVSMPKPHQGKNSAELSNLKKDGPLFLKTVVAIHEKTQSGGFKFKLIREAIENEKLDWILRLDADTTKTDIKPVIFNEIEKEIKAKLPFPLKDLGTNLQDLTDTILEGIKSEVTVLRRSELPKTISKDKEESKSDDSKSQKIPFEKEPLNVPTKTKIPWILNPNNLFGGPRQTEDTENPEESPPTPYASSLPMPIIGKI